MRIPSRAESMVAAVVGETNRLRVICCMMSPAMDRAIPVSNMAASRGIRLRAITMTSVSPPESSEAKSRDLAPMNNEITERLMRIRIRCRFFKGPPEGGCSLTGETASGYNVI